MPAQNNALKKSLSRASEINLSVTGRKSGRTLSTPVWFVLNGDKLYLLPVRGSNTQWYKNVLSRPAMRIEAGGAHSDLNVVTVTDPAEVSSVVKKFRDKYGVGDVKKYYSKFNVAVVAETH